MNYSYPARGLIEAGWLVKYPLKHPDVWGWELENEDVKKLWKDVKQEKVWRLFKCVFPSLYD